ncbi:hypothetical protein [Cytobacillus kochii]|uniref:Uncharacterized protein n=1 Tax=Cytobacillus kochii TaxID=859143 RepID=A0A286R819_9BACI|nr:hypothetical protein [Cytobacillus kochii]ASV70211.1 hypothetical protein CKF48_23285 [Cytobacillus kochii]
MSQRKKWRPITLGFAAVVFYCEQNGIHEDLVIDIISDISYYKTLNDLLEKEGDNVRDYFINNFEYDKDELIPKIMEYIEKKHVLQPSVYDFLYNTSFQEEIFEG